MLTANNHMVFDSAVDYYKYEMRALGKSEHTISDYSAAYKYFSVDHGQMNMHEMTRHHMVVWFDKMQRGVISPRGVAPRPPRKRSPKTIRNYHIALASLWTWALDQGYVETHVPRTIKPPKVHPKPIEPFTQAQIVALADACLQTKRWKTHPLTRTERATAPRDMALVLLLVDTGLRNAEIRGIRMEDINMQRRVIAVHWESAKNKKQRLVSFGSSTRKALAKWIDVRPEESVYHGDFLFVNMLRYRGHPLVGHNLNNILKRIGKRAGVAGVHTHRFRHTAAILRLKGGLNAFQLKEYMGHADMKTTLRYVHAARLDLDEALATSSPIDRLRLR